MSNSVEVAPLEVRKQSGVFSALPPWQGAALLLLLVWLYANVLARLFAQWTNDQNASHGFFVPIFAVFVLWKNRNELRGIEAAPSWTGLSLIVVGLSLLILGDYGAEIFLKRVSLLVLLAGLIILFHGWPLFRAVRFPWAFLFLMIPIPVILFQKVTFPLQILASKLASEALPLLGVVVHREGNIIELATMEPLQIVAACSGIRSLLSLVTLAIIYGYLMENRKWVRIVLALAAVPIAITANSFRIVGTGLLSLWDPKKAEGFYHIFEGWLIFIVSLIMLFALHRLITRIWKTPEQEGRSDRHPDRKESPPRSEIRVPQATLRFVVVALLMAASALVLWARPNSEVFPPRAPLSSLPVQIGDWQGEDLTIDQQTRDILGDGEFLNRSYTESAKPQTSIDLFIAYFPSQKEGDTLHSPNHCLLGAGWVPLKREVVHLTRPDGTSVPVNRAIWATSRAGRNLVIYWFQAHDRVVASEYLSKYYLVADSIRMNRSDGALVRLITPMYDRESADAAQARVLALGNQIIPQLNRYIPR